MSMSREANDVRCGQSETRMSMPKANRLQFADGLLTRPVVSGRDALATLHHFATISYAVDPARVRPHVHMRFDLDCFVQLDTGPRALVSMVPFEDQDFRFAGIAWAQFRFGQTNYRTYVIDRETGERAVWFFGTALDSWTVLIPRYVWRLPWHRGHMKFDCHYDAQAGRYTGYRMTTRSDWAPAEIELEDTGRSLESLDGVDDFEAGLVLLTHPLLGVFYRRDGKLGSYRIWHDRLQCNAGRCLSARIELFDRLGLVPFVEQGVPHSVLVQHETEFAIYLPPKCYNSRK
jgi:Uncharacterized conserved protein (COG2071)